MKVSMDRNELILGTEAVQDMLRKVHRIKGRDLRDMLMRSKRVLPRAHRKDGDILSDALDKIGHPKLEKMIDFKMAGAAQTRLFDHLKAIDLAERRRGRLLALGGVVALNILIVLGLFLTWMVWSGQI
ncbi:MAG: hypothetical protein AB8B71_10250 [Paracoccaceae bacterium]